jgi:outer membrane receptor protein involved in Fe transport
MGLLPNWTLTFDPTHYDTHNQSYGLLARVRRDLPRLRGQLLTGVDVDLSPGGHEETQIQPGTEKTTNGKTVFTSYQDLAVVYDYDATFLSVSPYVHAEASPLRRLRLSAGLRFDHMQYAYDDRLDAPPSARYPRPADAHRRYDQLSPKLGLTWRVAEAVDAFASYRHAFRAPSEGQLFRQGTARNTIDLQPIRAENLEAGLRVRPGARVSLEASVYQLDKHDDVLSYRNPVDGATEAVNAGHTRHRGVELGLTARPSSWLDLSASYARARHTYEEWVVDPRNADFSGKEMETAPRELGHLLVTVTPSRGRYVSLEVVHLGRYWMDAANTQTYGGHTLLNLRGQLRVRRGIALFARVLNLADTRYAESASFTLARGRELAPGMPRSAYVGLRLGR